MPSVSKLPARPVPETPLTRARTCLLALGIAIAIGVVVVPARSAQPPHGAPAATGHAETGSSHDATGATEETEGTHEGGGVIDTIARLVNFGILAGTLVYLLRLPVRRYLADRSAQIRSDLVNAAETKQAAAAEIDQIERKMSALPGELEALRAQGAEEIAAEEARIRAAAASERDRLLEQARREIDQQVKTAERELLRHAAELSVGVAAERIKETITDEDQKHLVDRYVQQLRPS
jgi:F-type H+-transporting ATPase subunit b